MIEPGALLTLPLKFLTVLSTLAALFHGIWLAAQDLKLPSRAFGGANRTIRVVP